MNELELKIMLLWCCFTSGFFFYRIQVDQGPELIASILLLYAAMLLGFVSIEMTEEEE